MADVVLAHRDGVIWTSRPAISSTGLVSIIHNRKHRRSAATPTLFRDVAFGSTGLWFVTVDARGHVVYFNLLQNKYEHVVHAGSPGVRAACHPLKKDEIVVSLEDCSVRVAVCSAPATAAPHPLRITLPVLFGPDLVAGALVQRVVRPADGSANRPQADRHVPLL